MAHVGALPRASSPGFNEAAVVRPRKYTTLAAKRPPCKASMRPRSNDRGLIEALQGGRFAASVVYFRGRTTAASLKPGDDALGNAPTCAISAVERPRPH